MRRRYQRQIARRCLSISLSVCPPACLSVCAGEQMGGWRVGTLRGGYSRPGSGCSLGSPVLPTLRTSFVARGRERGGLWGKEATADAPSCFRLMKAKTHLNQGSACFFHSFIIVFFYYEGASQLQLHEHDKRDDHEHAHCSLQQLPRSGIAVAWMIRRVFGYCMYTFSRLATAWVVAVTLCGPAIIDLTHVID